MFPSGNQEIYEDVSKLSAYLYYRELIDEQVDEFKNLGVNILADAPDAFKKDLEEHLANVLGEIVNVPENVGMNWVYEFLFVDGFNVILPNFISYLEVDSCKEFQLKTFELSWESFKESFVNSLEGIFRRLVNLQTLDPTIKHKLEYIALIDKFETYVSLAKAGDRNLFEFLRSVVENNFEELYSKI
ncbi:MAG: hypothetical protein QW835_00305 [Candidatus Hadarchaeum sp.]